MMHLPLHLSLPYIILYIYINWFVVYLWCCVFYYFSTFCFLNLNLATFYCVPCMVYCLATTSRLRQCRAIIGTGCRGNRPALQDWNAPVSVCVWGWMEGNLSLVYTLYHSQCAENLFWGLFLMISLLVGLLHLPCFSLFSVALYHSMNFRETIQTFMSSFEQLQDYFYLWYLLNFESLQSGKRYRSC